MQILSIRVHTTCRHCSVATATLQTEPARRACGATWSGLARLLHEAMTDQIGHCQKVAVTRRPAPYITQYQP